MCSAHLGSGPTYLSFLSNLPTNTKVFCMAYDCGKPDLSKGYQIPKSKLGVIMLLSETINIIELKFGKRIPYFRCILKPF